MSMTPEQIADSLTDEVWVPCPDFEGWYAVSSLGRVKSLERTIRTNDGRRSWLIAERVLARSFTRKGYLAVSLWRSGNAYPREVHRLVCRAFHGEPADGLEAAHLNGDKTDPRASNLAWTSKAENMRMKVSHGTQPNGERVVTAKLSTEQALEIFIAAHRGENMRQLARDYGVDDKTIRKIKRGEMWATQTLSVRAILKEKM